MSPEDFTRVQALMASRAGYRLTSDRIRLTEHRLGPVARHYGFEDVDAMLAQLWAKPVASLGWSVIEALLNTETWFNRDENAFEILGQELAPAMARARPGGKIRIWSAGCSTGQEAWSLAMCGLAAGVDVEVTGVDLSRRAVEKATEATYTAFEIQRGLSARTMLNWFEQVDDQWRAKPELREVVQFNRANLLDDPADDSRYDIIFCRHVLTDIDPTRRARVLDTLEHRLVDDGCLFLGPDERPEADSIAFRPVHGRKGLFVKSPTTLRSAA